MKHVLDGQSVIYCDHQGIQHDALVTTCWGETSFEDDGTGAPCINIVYVSKQEGKTDSNGQQLERDSSVVHKSNQTAPGNWWDLVS